MTASISCVVALVLALDVSGSVNEERWIQQRDGHANAFNSQIISNYIETDGRIAVSVVAFADSARTLLEWRILSSRGEIQQFSQDLASLQRPRLGLNNTFISSGVTHSIGLLEQELPCNPERRVIDVAADGDDDSYTATIVENAERLSIQINGLAIIAPNQVRDLDGWMRDTMITSDGFVVVSRGFEEIETAVRRKLEIEIIGELNVNR